MTAGSRDRPAFASPGRRVGQVFTRPTEVAVAVGLVKTRPTLPHYPHRFHAPASSTVAAI
jgi:hypothetical protein